MITSYIQNLALKMMSNHGLELQKQDSTENSNLFL